MGRSRKALWLHGHRGFESHPLRQFLQKVKLGGVLFGRSSNTFFENPEHKLDSASAKATADRSAGQTIFLGEWNCPASAFFTPAGGDWGGMRGGWNLSSIASEFRILESKMRHQRDVALDLPNPFAGNTIEAGSTPNPTIDTVNK